MELQQKELFQTHFMCFLVYYPTKTSILILPTIFQYFFNILLHWFVIWLQDLKWASSLVHGAFCQGADYLNQVCWIKETYKTWNGSPRSGSWIREIHITQCIELSEGYNHYSSGFQTCPGGTPALHILYVSLIRHPNQGCIRKLRQLTCCLAALSGNRRVLLEAALRRMFTVWHQSTARAIRKQSDPMHSNRSHGTLMS